MKINSITPEQRQQSFGMIKLGHGGSKRLAEAVPVLEAERIIRNNLFNDCDILVSEKATEIITPNKNFIIKVIKKIAGGKDFTDIEVSEHGKHGIFKITPGLSNKEINKYGEKLQDISLAEAISKIISKDYKWPNYLRGVNLAKSEEATIPRINDAIKQIEHFNNNVYTFG